MSYFSGSSKIRSSTIFTLNQFIYSSFYKLNLSILVKYKWSGSSKNRNYNTYYKDIEIHGERSSETSVNELVKAEQENPNRKKTLIALSSSPKLIIVKVDNQFNSYVSNLTHDKKIQNKANFALTVHF